MLLLPIPVPTRSLAWTPSVWMERLRFVQDESWRGLTGTMTWWTVSGTESWPFRSTQVGKCINRSANFFTSNAWSVAEIKEKLQTVKWKNKLSMWNQLDSDRYISILTYTDLCMLRSLCLMKWQSKNALEYENLRIFFIIIIYNEPPYYVSRRTKKLLNSKIMAFCLLGYFTTNKPLKYLWRVRYKVLLQY